MKKIVKEFVEFSDNGSIESLGRAEVYANLRLGLLHAEIGDIITTPQTAEIYVVTKNSWGNDEYCHKVARAYTSDQMSEASKYAQEVKDKYGQELREEIGSEFAGAEEGSSPPVEGNSSELQGEPSGNQETV